MISEDLAAEGEGGVGVDGLLEDGFCFAEAAEAGEELATEELEVDAGGVAREDAADDLFGFGFVLVCVGEDHGLDHAGFAVVGVECDGTLG